MEVKEWLESEDIKRLISEIKDKKDKLIPFVGSGVSIPNGLPSWKKLLFDLASGLSSDKIELIKDSIKENDYLYAGEIIRENVNSSIFSEKIDNVFRNFSHTPNETVKSIINLNSKFILTTNYDELLKTASYEKTKVMPLSFAHSSTHLANAKKTENFYIFHIHGVVTSPLDIILSESDYDRLIFDNKNFNSYMEFVLAQYGLFFIGYSFNDIDLTLNLKKLKSIQNGFVNQNYMFISEKESRAKKDKFEKLYNIKLIELPNYDFIPHFLNAINDKKIQNLEVKRESEFLKYPIDDKIKIAKEDFKIFARTLIDKTAELFNLKTGKYIHKNSRFGVIEKDGLVKIISLVSDFSKADVKGAIESFLNEFKDIEVKSFQIVTLNRVDDIDIYAQDNGYNYIAYRESLYKRLQIREFLLKEIKEFEDKFTLNSDYSKEPFIKTQKAKIFGKDGEFKIKELIEEFMSSKDTHLSILGEFGTGKTTLSKHLLYDFAKDYIDRNFRDFKKIPIRIELKNEVSFESFENLIEDWFKRHYIDMNFEIFKLLLEEDFILLILDGFDEMAIKLSFTERIQRVDMLSKIVENNSKIILLSRPNYFMDTQKEIKSLEDTKLSKLGEKLKEQSQIVILEEFNKSQIREYLKRAGFDENEAMKIIGKTYNLKDLSKKPLLLNMIRTTLDELKVQKEEKGSLSSFDIYETYIDKWAKQASLSNKFEKEDFIFIAEKLAEIFQKRKSERILAKDFEFEIQKFAEFKNFDEKEHFQSIIDEAFLRFEDGSYSFSIQSFLEFLIAKKIRENLRDGDSFSIFNSTEFSRETILFLSESYSELSDKRKIINSLYEKLNSFASSGEISKNIILTIYYLTYFNIELKDELKSREYKNIDFSGLDLNHFSFEDSKLFNCNFDSSDCSYINFNNSKVENCNFQKTNLEYTIWQNAKVKDNKFFYSNLNHSLFLIEDKNEFKNSTFYKSIYKQKDIENYLSLFSSNEVFEVSKLQELQNLIFQQGHSNWVQTLIKLDENTIASGSDDETIKIWDIKTLKEIATLKGHSNSVNTLIKLDDNTIASGSSDKSIKIWDIKNLKEIASLNGHSYSVRTLIKLDDNTIASGSSDETIKIWDIKSLKEIASLKGHSNSVNTLIKLDDNTIASGSSDKSIKIWDIKTQKEIASLNGHSNVVNSLIKLDDNTIASGSYDKTIKIWDIKTQKELASLNGHSSFVLSLIKLDDNTIASGSYDETIKIWDIKTQKELASLNGHSNVVNSLIKLDDNTIASGSYDKTIKIWDIKTQKELASLNGHSFSVRTLIKLDDNTIASGSHDRTIKIWDIKTQKELASLNGHSSSVLTLIKLDDNTIASGSSDETIKIWDIKSLKELASLNGHSNSVLSLIKLDDNTIASGSDDRTIKIWDIKNLKEIATLKEHSNWVNTLIKLDDNTIASGSDDNSIKIWDIKNLKEIATLKEHSNWVNTLIKLDDNTIASGSDDNSIKIWDIKTQKELATLNGHSFSVRTLIKLDDNTIASGSYDNSIKIWDIKTQKEIASLNGHSFSVRTLIKLDDNTIASGSDDRTIKIWDIKTLKEIAHIQLLRDDNYLFLREGFYTRSKESDKLIDITLHPLQNYPIWLQDEINGKSEQQIYESFISEAKSLEINSENLSSYIERISNLREAYLKYSYAYSIHKSEEIHNKIEVLAEKLDVKTINRIKIKSVRIENIKIFESISFEFGENINLIVGTNAKGKSTILQLLSMVLKGSEKPPFDINLWQDLKYDVDRDSFIKLNLITSKGEFTLKFELKEDKFIFDKSDKNFNDFVEMRDDFLILGYGVQRNYKLESVIKDDKFNSIASLFGINGHLKNPKDDGVIFNLLTQNNNFEKIKELINKFLDKSLGITLSSFDKDSASFKFSTTTTKRDLKLEVMSDGFKSTFVWLFDFAIRILQKSKSLNNLEYIYGVVFIDEIDLHLHPSWQRKILDSLKKTFKNIQFIITTHSPFIIQSLDNQNIITLKEEKDKIEAKTLSDKVPIGMEIEVVISELMGVENSTLSISLYQKLIDFEKFVEDGNKREVTKLFNELKEIIPTNSDYYEHIELMSAGLIE